MKRYIWYRHSTNEYVTQVFVKAFDVTVDRKVTSKYKVCAFLKLPNTILQAYYRAYKLSRTLK